LLPPDPQANINALSALLQGKGLDAGDFIDVINALANIKKRDAEKQEKEEQKEVEKKNKIFVDKEFIIPTREDCFIYKDGRTKSGRYFVRIYDAKKKKAYIKSLGTTNRLEAIYRAEKIYVEMRDKLGKGVNTKSITTKELIDIYLKQRFSDRSDIPHHGITIESYDNLIKKLKYWEEYISFHKHTKTKIENIPPELGKSFAVWISNQPKKFYKDRPERSRETINSIVGAVKKMYKDVAIEEKYITLAEFPIFKNLKVNREVTHKRDVLEKEEYEAICKWMNTKWCREKDIDELEMVKRRCFALYFSLQYNLGTRNKEQLGIKWKDISKIKTDTKENQRINRSVFIPTENSKTGRSRYIVAPIAIKIERLQSWYKRLGIEWKQEDFVFINLAKTKRGTNTPYQQPAMEKRLKAVLEGSERDGVWKPEGRNITQYSARHYYATDRLREGVNIYDLAINMGTSVQYLQSTYSHLTALMKSEELTAGQGIHKANAEREKRKESAEKAINAALSNSTKEQMQKQVL
jgi:hypothetical protein